MMIRALFANSVEAAEQAPGKKLIEFRSVTFGQSQKFLILLEREYADANDIETMRKMARVGAEYTMAMRVGRAVIFAMAKRLNQEWILDDMDKAHAPEALSLAADDCFDSMQNVPRRKGKALRASKSMVEEFEPA